jgi:hypothetical protein
LIADVVSNVQSDDLKIRVLLRASRKEHTVVLRFYPDIHTVLGWISLWWRHLPRRKAALPQCYPDQNKYEDSPEASSTEFFSAVTGYERSKKVIHKAIFPY